jgi:pSer/pThr/pTyr-binding forkhead associated (FHA) protein
LKSPVILRIYKNNQLVVVKQFDKDQIIFGQEADVTVELTDDKVSPIHCLVELRDNGYYLCDLGSAHGTFKNGQQVLDEPISSGDNIEIGPYKIQFFVGVPKPAAAPSEPSAAAVAAVKSVNKTANEEKTQIPVPPKAPVTPAKPAAVPQSVPSTVTPKYEAPPAPKLPETATRAKAPNGNGKKKTDKWAQTYAPGSEIKDLKTYLRPTKGPVVEVIVAWQDRVIGTHHFGGGDAVSIGSSEKSQVWVPSIFVKGALPFLELQGGCRVITTPDMSVELVTSNQPNQSLDELLKNGKAIRAASGNAVRLDQGDLLCLSIGGGDLQLFVRYVPNTVKPMLAPPLDFSAGELTGLIVSLVIVSLMALYMSVYTPPSVDEQKDEDQVRLAQFIYNKPPPTPKAEPRPEPTKEKVETTPKEPPKKVKVSMEEKPKVQQGHKESPNTVKQTEAAKASEVRPMPKTDRPKKFTSVHQGGSVKVGKTAGANAQSKDVNSMGLLSAFGGGGVRKQLDQAYSGSGELLGMANSATGTSGQNEDRNGDDIGSKFKDTGAGGKGTATQGIAGIGTKGRGSGMSNYGSGIGLGGKGNVTIDVGGEEEGWEGTIDREAVRRVIRSILSQIKSCYERQLRVKSDLEGKVVIEFEIIEQGRVRVAKTKSSTMNDPTVESCVAGRIKSARFPEPPTGTIAVVDYPFVFGKQQ